MWEMLEMSFQNCTRVDPAVRSRRSSGQAESLNTGNSSGPYTGLGYCSDVMMRASHVWIRLSRSGAARGVRLRLQDELS